MITVYLDTETGGVEPHRPTIQFAAVARDGGIELGAFEQKITFVLADADPEALKLNHYTPEAWVNAVAPVIAASRFAAWLRPFCALPRVSKAGNAYHIARLAVYNAPFDVPRLEKLFGTQFCPWDRRVRDVLQRALFWSDERGIALENYRLSTVAAYLGIQTDGAHDALADARMAALVYEAIVEREREGVA